MLPNFEPLHPAEFRRKHRLSRYQVHLLSKISFDTVKNWLADKTSNCYREPTEAVKLYFGLLDSLCSPLNASTRRSQGRGEL